MTDRAVEVITGPTAAGKSALAFELAKADPTIEIVNADAFQVYRSFSIGTSKPTLAEQQRVKHHLIDILDPHEFYSAGQYARDARRVIEQLIAKGKRPLVVGGTGLYIDALFWGISTVNVDPETKEAAKLRYEQELLAHGFEKLHAELRPIDPILYEQIAREHNPVRLERAWTHYYATGIPLGIARAERPEPFRFSPAFTVLQPERKELHANIALRIDTMLQAGWLEEVRSLLLAGVTTSMPAMRAIGYQELAAVVAGKLLLEEAREQIKIKTRQYAKRQMTWMRRYLTNKTPG